LGKLKGNNRVANKETTESSIKETTGAFTKEAKESSIREYNRVICWKIGKKQIVDSCRAAVHYL
jgi:hypothetical protein